MRDEKANAMCIQYNNLILKSLQMFLSFVCFMALPTPPPYSFLFLLISPYFSLFLLIPPFRCLLNVSFPSVSLDPLERRSLDFFSLARFRQARLCCVQPPVTLFFFLPLLSRPMRVQTFYYHHSQCYAAYSISISFPIILVNWLSFFPRFSV